MNKKWLLLFPALALALAGCNGGGKSTPTTSSQEQETVKAVTLDVEQTSIEVRQTIQLNANVTPVTLSDRTVTWSSNNEAVATVNVSGQVLGVTEGTAKIRATSNLDNTKYAECDVTVTKHYVAFEQLTADTEHSYKFSCLQENIDGGTRYYFTGEVGSDTRGVTSASLADAVDVKLEAAATSGKYYLSFTKDSAKKYLEMDDAHHYALADTPTAGREWSWNDKAKTVARTIGSTTYFPGTYNSFTTISGCDIAQLSGDFVFRFVEMVEEADPTAVAITEESVTIRPYESAQLTATIEPKGAAEAELVWSVTMKDGSASDGKVTVNNGKVTVAGDAVKDTEYTVKATWGELAGDTCTVKVGEKLNYGTAEAPLTVAQAKATIDASKDQKTAVEIYVKGVVTANGAYDGEKKYWSEIWLTDGKTELAFEGYHMLDGSADGAYATTYKDKDSMFGYNATMVGKALLYKSGSTSTYEITAGTTSKLTKLEDAAQTATGIELTPSQGFKLRQGQEKAVSGKILPYGTKGTLEWAVTPANQGVTYEEGKVKASATATAGTYTLTASVGTITKSLTITVAENDGSVDLVFDVTAWATENNAESGKTKFTSITLNDVVTIAVSGSDANTGKLYGPGSSTGLWEVRCYKSGSAKLTISVASGYTLTEASGVVASANWAAGSETSFTIVSNGVEFNNNDANFNFKSISVTYKANAA